MIKPILCSALVTSLLTVGSLVKLERVAAQLVPEPWVSVGVQNSDVTYSVGARAFDLGVELGVGRAGATGVDGLKFFSLPLPNRVSPYVGLGIYSGDESLAYSGGVQISPADRLTLGVGYHSIRGVNGQVGIRLF